MRHLSRFCPDDKALSVWVTTGFGAGVAMGTATHSMWLWMALGAAIGGAIGFVLDSRRNGNES